MAVLLLFYRKQCLNSVDVDKLGAVVAAATDFFSAKHSFKAKPSAIDT